VQIPPFEFYKRSRHEVEDKINEKYSNKVVQKVGLCVCMYDLLKVSDGLIGHGTGFVNVNGAPSPLPNFEEQCLICSISSRVPHDCFPPFQRRDHSWHNIQGLERRHQKSGLLKLFFTRPGADDLFQSQANSSMTFTSLRTFSFLIQNCASIFSPFRPSPQSHDCLVLMTLTAKILNKSTSGAMKGQNSISTRATSSACGSKARNGMISPC